MQMKKDSHKASALVSGICGVGLMCLGVLLSNLPVLILGALKCAVSFGLCLHKLVLVLKRISYPHWSVS